MFPGQRTSRRTQNIEALSVNLDGDDDGFDEFGIPTASKAKGPRSSGTGGKTRNKFFSRRRRGSSSALADDLNDSDDDDDGGVVGGGAMGQMSGFTVMNGYGSQNASMTRMAPPQGPQGMDNMQGQVGSRSSLQNMSANPQGEISMDEISSLRDRHRYPAINDDPRNGRAMSLTSMSNYDSTPVIPTIGGGSGSGLGSGGSGLKGTPQDKYRQRMIESRRALMSSETGITLGATAPAPDTGAPRTMSMGSMQGQPGGRVASGPRSNTMNSQMNPQFMPGPMGGPAMGGPPMGGPPMGGPIGGPMGGPPMGGNYQRSSQGAPHPMMRQGLGVQGMPPGGAMPYGGMQPGYMQQGHMQRGSQTMLPQGQPGNPNMMGPQGPYQQQHLIPPQMQPPTQGRSMMAPPLSTPQLDGTPMRDSMMSPGGRMDPNQQQHYYQQQQQQPLPRGMHPPQVGLPKDSASESNEFDFGSSTAAESLGSKSVVDERTPGSQTQLSDTANLDALQEEIKNLKDDLRVLSIELSESVRRELDLPNENKTPQSEEDASRAEAIARAHSELALERAKREAVYKATASNHDSVETAEKLADLEHRHAEALHLLAIRTEQYDTLKKRHTMLEKDFTQHKQDTERVVNKAKESQVSDRLYKQDQQLKAQLDVLETENAKLREQLDQCAARGPLGGRVTALENQRSALQEALRAMRERKDAEITALNNRIEQLSLSQQRTVSTGSSVLSSSAGRAVSSSSLMALKEGSKHSSPAPSTLGTNNSTAAVPATSNDDSQLSLPRIRHSMARPASPLRLGLDYSR